MRFTTLVPLGALAATVLAGSQAAHAGERITLRNGFSVSCDRSQPIDAEHVRLFLRADSGSYVDIAASSIAFVEPETLPVQGIALTPATAATAASLRNTPSATAVLSIDTLVQQAGQARRINVDLLRSVVHAESGGRPRAVSHAGAQGLMQLMPATAQSLGVRDSFEPEQNLRGGTDYLDALLRRYHDDLPLALAAYNAGPAAVDRYHGVPPYRETRLYVAQIIREFNRRTLLSQHNGHVKSTSSMLAEASATR